METLPQDVKTCALYLGGDGSLGIAWAGGVCALTPMEAAMQSLSLAETKALWKCNDQLAELNYERFAHMLYVKFFPGYRAHGANVKARFAASATAS